MSGGGSIVVHACKGLTAGGAVCTTFAPIVVIVVAIAALGSVNSTVVAVVVVVIVVVVVGRHIETVFSNLSFFTVLEKLHLHTSWKFGSEWEELR